MVWGRTKFRRDRNGSGGSRSVPDALIRHESGQSLVIVVIAMGLIIAMAAFSLDAGQWYVNRHQAQVVADASALAAANCLASTKCTQTTSSGDTATIAGNYSANNVRITNVAFTGSTVKVTTQKTGSSAFAGLFGVNSVNSSASATASYNTRAGYQSACASTGATNCISLFAGNTTCPSTTPPANYVGLNLVTNDSGGGSSTMSDAFTNGYYYNGAASGSYTVSDVACSTDNEKKASNSTLTPVAHTYPYPEPWTQPTCTFSSSSYATATVTTPGVYCATGTLAGGGCTSTATGAGTIDLTLGSLASGAYEFVGPCVVLNGSSPSVTAITGQPLVYGTSNITKAGTTAALPTCKVNDGSTGTTTWLTGNGSSLDAAVYDQCGTFEETANSGFAGFVEAWNIAIDKNNLVTGDGPTSLGGGGMTMLPGGDSLVG